MPKASNSGEQGHNFWDLALNGLDDTVTPAIVSFGNLGKDNTGTWRYITVSSSGYLMVSGSFGTLSFSNDASNQRVSAFSNDAGLMRVSAVGGSTVSLSADAVGNRVSALQMDAANLRISARSDDAGLFRVSALGVTVTTSPLSADSSSISAKQSDATNLRISARSDDAGLFRVSALGVTVTTSPLSADSSSISAKQSDAGLLLVSAKQGDAGLFRTSSTITNTVTRVSADVLGNFISANQYLSAVASEGTAFIGQVSAKSGSADQLRVSALVFDAEYSAGPNVIVSATGVPATSSMKSILATVVSLSAGTLRTSAFQGDAAFFHVSAIGSLSANQQISAQLLGSTAFIGDVSAVQGSADQLRISALNQDANFMHVSGFSPDAGLFRVSALGVTVTTSPLSADSSSISAKQGDAGLLHTSAWIDSGSVSAKSATATQFVVSAAQSDAGILLVSAKSGTATQMVVSAAQSDATLLRVSATLYPDTVGDLTVFQTLSVSASQNVKSTAGSIYGWYAWNKDTHVNFLKFYNVSGATNLGTDTPIMTLMLPVSGAANVFSPHGLVGFTNGIGIAATSGVPIDNTTLPAASSVGLMLFYK